MNNKCAWNTRVNGLHTASAFSDVFLSELATELDNDPFTAVILRGSYARGDAVPYSDVDLTRLVKKQPEPTQRSNLPIAMVSSSAFLHERSISIV